MSVRPAVDSGVRLLEAPEGADESAYWDRVRVIHERGTPWYNSCRLAREEFLGTRHVDGPPKRPKPRQFAITPERQRVIDEFVKARR